MPLDCVSWAHTTPSTEGVQWHHEARSPRRRGSIAADVASISKANPYIQRLIEDAKLRDNMQQRVRVDASAPTRVCSNGKAPPKALIEDKKLQRDLRRRARGVARRDHRAQRGAEEAASARRPAARPQAADPAVWPAAWRWPVSEKLRSKVLDTLFGKEEEFEYTPPPATASDAARRRRSAPPSSRRSATQTRADGGAPAWRLRALRVLFESAPVEAADRNRARACRASSRATRRPGSSRRCASAWPRAASPGSTFDHVAREAGVSRGLLHYYFGTKERLLVEVVRRECDVRDRAAGAGDRGAGSADDVLAALVQQLRGLPRRGPGAR